MTASLPDTELDTELDIEEELEEESEEPVSMSYDITSYPSDYTLSGLAQMWADGDIKIPSYQREFVWSIKQSSLLIDSFLCGLPVPPVFFYIDEKNRNLVIDGQQRILSIVFFMDGYFGKESTHGKRQVFRLSGLNKNSPYYNLKFSDLEESDQRKLKQSVLRAINIRQMAPIGESTSAYHIFERLNTGGTPLKPQEIRNCVFMGEFSEQLKKANTDPNWRKIIGRPFLDKHQKDTELLLRVFALTGTSEKYEKPMREFLNAAMKKNENANTAKVKNFFQAFPKATSLIVETLGEKPFHLRGPLNMSALDSVMCVIIEKTKTIKPESISKAFSSLLKDKRFQNLTSYNTTDAKTLQDRFNVVREYL
ncbi:DUF262 domain-containing protein [Pseudomonas sp. ES4]|uniref:DUF262 domain-containing protein n=1 Tax=Pseudomonas sp. ES4 TaxID=3424777 RepID=UPI003D340793